MNCANFTLSLTFNVFIFYYSFKDAGCWFCCSVSRPHNHSLPLLSSRPQAASLFSTRTLAVLYSIKKEFCNNLTKNWERFTAPYLWVFPQIFMYTKSSDELTFNFRVRCWRTAQNSAEAQTAARRRNSRNTLQHQLHNHHHHCQHFSSSQIETRTHTPLALDSPREKLVIYLIASRLP